MMSKWLTYKRNEHREDYWEGHREGHWESHWEGHWEDHWEGRLPACPKNNIGNNER